MADNDNTFGSFLAGILIGGLVGAAAALLLAPQSGEETRAQIKEKSIEIRDRAETTLEDAKSKASQSVEYTRARVDELSQKVAQKMTPPPGEVALDDASPE
jgi:gas vesicle protein